MENTNKTELLFGFINLNERKQLIGVLISISLFFGFLIYIGISVFVEIVEKIIETKNQETLRAVEEKKEADKRADKIFHLYINHLEEDRKKADSSTVNYVKLKKEIDHEKNR